MSNLNQELLIVAEENIGRPFRHHFKPNLCNGGWETIDTCMEAGMDQNGFDCMGLVIYSLCKVLDIDSTNWPRELRHSLQLRALAHDRSHLRYGDILLIESLSPENRPYMTHMGFYEDASTIIHASGISGVVERTPISSLMITELTVLNTDELIGRLRSC